MNSLKKLLLVFALVTVALPLEAMKRKAEDQPEGQHEGRNVRQKTSNDLPMPSIENINKVLADIKVNGKSVEMCSVSLSHEKTCKDALEKAGFCARCVKLYFSEEKTQSTSDSIGYVRYVVQPEEDGYIIYVQMIRVDPIYRMNGFGGLLVLASLHDALSFFDASMNDPLLKIHAIIAHPGAEKIFSKLEFTRTIDESSKREVGSNCYICDMTAHKQEARELLEKHGPKIFEDIIAHMSSEITPQQQENPRGTKSPKKSPKNTSPVKKPLNTATSTNNATIVTGGSHE